MKRLVIFLAALLAIGAGLFWLAPRLVSIEGVRRSLAHEIAGWSGRALTFDGTPTIAFTPYLTVTFPKAMIGSKTGETTLVEMESLSAEIPVLPLLFGQLEPSAFDMQRPIFHFQVDAGGGTNWTLPKGLDETSRVDRLTIEDGTIHYADRAGRVIEISSLNAALSWPGPERTGSAKGSAVWQSEPIDFNGSIGAMTDLSAGRATAVRLAIASAPLRASFSGTLQKLDGLRSTGKVSITTPSIRRLATLLGAPMTEGSTLGSASIDASANLTNGMLTLSDARMALDGNEGEGALAIDFEGERPALQGTLAFDTLDLSAYAEAIQSALATASQAPDTPLPWPSLDPIDVDLRLSADQIRIGDKSFGRTAASAGLRAGRFDLAVGDMQLYGGRLSASFSADLEDAVPSLALQTRLDALSVRRVLSDLTTLSGFAGTGSASFNLAARGQSWNALIGSLAGHGSATVTGGSMDGVNVQALRSIPSSDGAIAGRLMTGTTRFAKADSVFTIDRGAVHADTDVEGDGYSVQVSGDMPPLSAALSARGSITLQPITPAAGEPTKIPFAVGGSWAHPLLVPDFTGLIHHDTAQ